MIQLQTILAPTDFSANAAEGVRCARDLAQTFGARLIVVHVADPSYHVYAAYQLGGIVADFEREARRAIEKRLDEIALELRGNSVVVATQMRQGSPAHEIVELARREDADLIVIATHGHTGVRPLLLGSIAEKVVRTAPCPVLTVRPGAREPAHG